MNEEEAELHVVIKQFAGLAVKFCSLVENHEALSLEQFADQCTDTLTALYHVGLSLPDEVIDTIGIAVDEAKGDYHKIHLDVGRKFGKYNFYWEVFDPYELEEPVTGCLGDDIADIYSELRQGLQIFDKGSDKEISEAVWHWQFSFKHHWGDHVIDALRALHRLRSKLRA